jgi:glutathione S-transferase
MTTYLLASFKTCPWVQRAAIVLREKNIAFEFRHIDPDNRPDWFLSISPHKKVPVLRIDEKVSLFESNAIAEYLDETTPPRLHPDDPVLRAISRAWTDYVPTFANLVTAGAYADDEASYKASAENIPVAFERLNWRWQGKTRDRSLMAPNTRWSMPPMHRFYSGIFSLIA